jgi:hypothetical protein
MKILSNIELTATGSFPSGSYATSAVPTGFMRLFVFSGSLYSHTPNGTINRLHRL